MSRTRTKASGLPVDDTPEPPPMKLRKGNVLNLKRGNLGGNTYADKTLAPLFAQPIEKKQGIGRNTWADTSLILVQRAKKAAQTYGKKDFNALYRLVLSAGIAFDKAFPTQVQQLGGNLVIQLFGSLGVDTTKSILEPPRPIIVDIIPSTPHHHVEAYLGETIEVPNELPLVVNGAEPSLKDGDPLPHV